MYKVESDCCVSRLLLSLRSQRFYKKTFFQYSEMARNSCQGWNRYSCTDALTNWAGHLWVLMTPWRMDMKLYMKCLIYWTADLKSSKPWLSQLRTLFLQLHIEAWKRGIELPHPPPPRKGRWDFLPIKSPSMPLNQLRACNVHLNLEAGKKEEDFLSWQK